MELASLVESEGSIQGQLTAPPSKQLELGFPAL